MLPNNYQKYQQNSILTASPQELTLMLYNGAIKFCNLGIEMIQKRDMEKAHNNIIKAQNIMLELQVTLDDKYPIAKEIRPLYEYISRLLVEANVNKDEQKLLEAKELITQFRDLWKEVIKKPR